MPGYEEYLRSPEWRRKKRKALERAGNRCHLCSTRWRLDVHHNTYERIGRERPEDLVVLCRLCHTRHHDVVRAPQRAPADPAAASKALAAFSRARARVEREKGDAA
jgi:hypothetical protein